MTAAALAVVAAIVAAWVALAATAWVAGWLSDDGWRRLRARLHLGWWWLAPMRWWRYWWHRGRREWWHADRARVS